MEDIITLVGPPAAGKSVVGKALAEALRYRYVNFDDIMMVQLHEYGGIIGYGYRYGFEEYYTRVYEALLAYFVAHKGEKFVLDLGGGIISSEFPVSEKNASLVKEHSTILLLLPHAEDDKNIRVLLERELERKHTMENYWPADWDAERIKAHVINHYYDRLPGLRKHAKYKFYAEDKSPADLAKIIIAELQSA